MSYTKKEEKQVKEEGNKMKWNTTIYISVSFVVNLVYSL